jgi:hypothetical protein
LAVTDGFLRPIRKMRSILRAQKTVAEQNTTKGDSPTGVLRSLAAYWRRTVTVLLYAVQPDYILKLFILNYFLLFFIIFYFILYFLSISISNVFVLNQ